MAFSELFFLFRFFPVFLAIYYIVPDKYKNMVLLLGSVVFYTIGDPRFILLLLGMVGVNYLMARLIHYRRVHKQRSGCKGLLVILLLLDVGVLAAFKIMGAFPDSFFLDSVLPGSVLPGSALPLGLSFYIFKMISFQIDFYRGHIEGMPSFQKTAVYFMMFPQIASGPIMRFGAGFGQPRTLSPEALEKGLWYFAIGLGTKVLLADRLAILWKDIHAIGYESISTPLAWLGAASYSMQLYFDFWGYSLMASGICVMLGFPFIKNFDFPYASRSIGEFWRRWHMTLGSFFRDYVYIPLGGSRGGMVRTVGNLLVVWLATGLWHGGSRNFILWGLLLFVFIMLEKLCLGRVFEKFPFIGRCWVLAVIPVSWVFFAITDLGQLGLYLGRMFPFIGGEGIAVNPRDVVKYLGMYWKYLLAGAIWCIPAAFRLFERHRRNPIIVALTALVFWFSVYCVVSMGNNPFVYLMF